ncbi:MAG: hypothetical protein V4618_00720 [Pseudomonadota bacterium]
MRRGHFLIDWLLSRHRRRFASWFTNRGASHGASRGDGARDCPPNCASSPIVAGAPIGERHSGRLWEVVRWRGTLTLLVGPGVTLTLSASDVDAIHAATGRAIAARKGKRA